MINVSEYKRRMRVAFDEIGQIELDDKREPKAREFDRVTAILLINGIELGEDATLSWDKDRFSWEIR